jgi:perosamine synthetase
MRIPVCEPYLTGKEKGYVLDCLETNWISSAGKYIDRLESEFSEYCGVSSGAVCTSGTTAIHLAVKALGLKAGDEIILPTFTMMASLLPLIYEGIIPRFVDAESDTWNMKPSEIEQHLSPNTKAIMVVHIYGHPVDMNPVWKIAQKHKLKIIEDAAEAHGAEFENKKAGSLGDIACFSFYANKIMTSGEGGIVVSDNNELIQKCKYYRNLGFDPDPEKRFIHQDVGHNYRMTNIQAALACAQLESLDLLVQKRRNNANQYIERLSDLNWLQLPVEKPWAKNVYWMFGIVLKEDAPLSLDDFRKKLKEKGVDTRRFFYPLHRQPVLKKLEIESNFDCPVADSLWKNGLYLPSGSGLSEDQIKYTCDVIHEHGA